MHNLPQAFSWKNCEQDRPKIRSRNFVDKMQTVFSDYDYYVLEVGIGTNTDSVDDFSFACDEARL